MAITQSLPHWDMSVIYPDLESPEFVQGIEHTVEKIVDLVKLFDVHQVMKRPHLVVDENLVQTFETIVEHYVDLFEDLTIAGI